MAVAAFASASVDLAISLDSPTNGQVITTTPITASATPVNGTGPYTVKFYSNVSGSMQQVGGDVSSPPYQVSLGSPA